MMVGQDEAVGRDEGAGGPDLDDAVDEADAVGAEDLLGGDLEASGPEVELADLADGPHALLGPGRGQRDDDSRDEGEERGAGEAGDAASSHDRTP